MSRSPEVRCQGPGRPKDMDKRAAILKSATALFMRSSFAGTSMDAVASDAGVSKLTVYSHFGDKDSLFREVIRGCMQDAIPDEKFTYHPDVEVVDVLTDLARRMVHIDTDPQMVSTFRVIFGDCRQGNPRYGRLVWEEGPLRGRQLAAALLAQAEREGKLDLGGLTPEVAATQFFSLIKGDLMMRRLCGCDEVPEPECRVAVEQIAMAGVRTFLRAFQPR
ncbi:TetR/AcrR family transcriptional regulator [Frateuria aurantia]